MECDKTKNVLRIVMERAGNQIGRHDLFLFFDYFIIIYLHE